MAKGAYKRKRRYKTVVHRQLRDGMVNRADGTWRPHVSGEENVDYMQVYARRAGFRRK